MRIKATDPRLVSLMGEFMRTYLPGVRNRDKDTIDSYRYSINLFVTYLESEKKVTVLTMQSSDFSQKNIVEFMAWLKSERKNVAPTINHRLSDLRGFCKYLYKKNAISLDEYEAIREISDVDDERVIDFTWLSVNDVYLILKSTDSNREAIRDRFLLSLLYESGARINEVLSLKLLDVKATSNGEADVHIYGKGKKHRIIPLSKEIWSQFEGYCEKYHPDKTSENQVFYSFRNGRRNKMSSDNVSRILEVCEEEVCKSNPKLIHLHSHLFRRTRAMHLYQAGVPLPTISEWLGHSNIETTRFYAKVTEEMKREALHKLSDSDSSVFKDDVAFKYANDEDTIKRLCGLK
jgi:site-specific recombinase XerD